MREEVYRLCKKSSCVKVMLNATVGSVAIIGKNKPLLSMACNNALSLQVSWFLIIWQDKGSASKLERLAERAMKVVNVIHCCSAKLCEVFRDTYCRGREEERNHERMQQELVDEGKIGTVCKRC